MEINGYVWRMIEGVQLTLSLAICSMLLALLFGLFGCFGKLSSSRLARTVANTYTVVVRGVPELIMLLLIYYGVPTLIQDIAASLGYTELIINFNPFIAGTLTLGFIYGAFATEVLRGAYQSLPKGQLEAAMAMGMSPRLSLQRVILPQMLRVAIPGLSNVWLILLKATALVSIIQLNEIMRQAEIAAGATREYFTYFFIASVLFLLITLVSMYLQRHLERWANQGFAERH